MTAAEKNISLKGVLWDCLSIFDDLNKAKISKIEYIHKEH